MTQQDKELLIKDLCARLPYEVKLAGKRIAVLSSIETSVNGVWLTTRHYHAIGCSSFKFHINNIEQHLPYLRPMSSMTEEENEEFERTFDTVYNINDYGEEDDSWHEEMSINLFDWLNHHHFDYRGLIEKGLALEALEGIYNINKE